MGTHPIFESDFDCLTDCEPRLADILHPEADMLRPQSRSKNQCPFTTHKVPSVWKTRTSCRAPALKWKRTLPSPPTSCWKTCPCLAIADCPLGARRFTEGDLAPLADPPTHGTPNKENASKRAKNRRRVPNRLNF